MCMETNNKLKNIHPGEILEEEFLKPLGITKYKIAKDINVSQTAISEITKGVRNISTEMAIRLSKYFDTSVKFWLNLQNEYNIEEFLSKNKDFGTIKKYSSI